MSKEVLHISNEKELMKLFEELTEKNQKKVAVSAMKKSASIILNEAKSRFNGVKKGKSKTNYKNITFKSKSMRNKIGVVLGVKDYKARFIDKGTKDRYFTSKSGKKHFTGKIEPTNFFSGAVEAKENEAQKTISDNLIISLERLVKKYNK